MRAILRNRTYRHLFAAQVIALLGTGLMTVALGLLAYDLAGADAGAVLGTALAIKMIAYVGVAPVAQAFTDRMPRRSLLVGLDLIRGAVALCLPFVAEIWQIYLLIFVAGRLGRLHADLPGYHSEHFAGRGRIDSCAFAVAAGLRPCKSGFANAGSGPAQRHQLSQPVRWHGLGVPGIRRTGLSETVMTFLTEIAFGHKDQLCLGFHH